MKLVTTDIYFYSIRFTDLDRFSSVQCYVLQTKYKTRPSMHASNLFFSFFSFISDRHWMLDLVLRIEHSLITLVYIVLNHLFRRVNLDCVYDLRLLICKVSIKNWRTFQECEKRRTTIPSSWLLVHLVH
jgi:hypothetical protein